MAEPLVYRLTPGAEAIAINPSELRLLLRDGVIAGYRTDGGDRGPGHRRIPRTSVERYIVGWCEQEAAERGEADGERPAP